MKGSTQEFVDACVPRRFYSGVPALGPEDTVERVEMVDSTLRVHRIFDRVTNHLLVGSRDDHQAFDVLSQRLSLSEGPVERAQVLLAFGSGCLRSP